MYNFLFVVFDFPDLNFLCQSALKLEENVLSGERERIGTIKLAGVAMPILVGVFFLFSSWDNPKRKSEFV